MEGGEGQRGNASLRLSWWLLVCTRVTQHTLAAEDEKVGTSWVPLNTSYLLPGVPGASGSAAGAPGSAAGAPLACHAHPVTCGSSPSDTPCRSPSLETVGGEEHSEKEETQK